ncbi:GNAT family protein [Streptomyces diastatochromogenes]|nr:GNAT family protein [Streptomyces diastatochromogenes]
MRRADLSYAGGLQLEHRAGEVGGWLAPRCRGQGLGAELFGAGALLAHTHFGMTRVRAGAEPGNTASRRALARAGFVPDEGPPRHTLPDGRVIEAVWVRHDTTAAAHCS